MSVRQEATNRLAVEPRARRTVLKALIAFSLAGSLGTPQVQANADDDAVAREVALAAAKAGATEAAKGYLNGAFPKPAGSSGPGTGTVVVSAVELGFALHDLSKADTDKGRFHTGMNAGMAVYSMAAGPGAPIVAAGLLAASLLESGLDARHQKVMLEIYRQIEEDIKRQIEIETQFANAEAQVIQLNYYSAVRESALVATNERYVQQHCSDLGQLTTIEVMDGCVLGVNNILVSERLFLQYADAVLSFRGTYFNGPALMDKVHPGASSALAGYRTTYVKAVQEEAPVIHAAEAGYERAVAAAILQAAADQPVITAKEELLERCLNQYSDAVMRGAIAEVRITRSRTPTEQCTAREALQSSIDRMDELAEAACKTSAESADPADALARMLSSLLKQAAESRARLSGQLDALPNCSE